MSLRWRVRCDERLSLRENESPAACAHFYLVATEPLVRALFSTSRTFVLFEALSLLTTHTPFSIYACACPLFPEGQPLNTNTGLGWELGGESKKLSTSLRRRESKKLSTSLRIRLGVRWAKLDLCTLNRNSPQIQFPRVRKTHCFGASFFDGCSRMIWPAE